MIASISVEFLCVPVMSSESEHWPWQDRGPVQDRCNCHHRQAGVCAQASRPEPASCRVTFDDLSYVIQNQATIFPSWTSECSPLPELIEVTFLSLFGLERESRQHRVMGSVCGKFRKV